MAKSTSQPVEYRLCPRCGGRMVKSSKAHWGGLWHQVWRCTKHRSGKGCGASTVHPGDVIK